MALLIDHFWLFGMRIVPVTPTRLAGASCWWRAWPCCAASAVLRPAAGVAADARLQRRERNEGPRSVGEDDEVVDGGPEMVLK